MQDNAAFARPSAGAGPSRRKEVREKGLSGTKRRTSESGAGSDDELDENSFEDLKSLIADNQAISNANFSKMHRFCEKIEANLKHLGSDLEGLKLRTTSAESDVALLNRRSDAHEASMKSLQQELVLVKKNFTEEFAAFSEWMANKGQNDGLPEVYYRSFVIFHLAEEVDDISARNLVCKVVGIPVGKVESFDRIGSLSDNPDQGARTVLCVLTDSDALDKVLKKRYELWGRKVTIDNNLTREERKLKNERYIILKSYRAAGYFAVWRRSEVMIRGLEKQGLEEVIGQDGTTKKVRGMLRIYTDPKVPAVPILSSDDFPKPGPRKLGFVPLFEDEQSAESEKSYGHDANDDEGSGKEVEDVGHAPDDANEMDLSGDTAVGQGEEVAREEGDMEMEGEVGIQGQEQEVMNDIPPAD
jgi:hypothetical protein